MRNFWTPDEDATLIAAYKETTNMKKILPRLPGRTAPAIRCRARCLGIKMIDHRMWTEEDIEKVRGICDGRLSIKNAMHLFPGRTYLSVKQAVSRLGFKKKKGGYSWVWDSVVRELKIEPGQPGRTLEKKIGACYRQIIDVLYAHNRMKERSVFISGWVRSKNDPRFPGQWVPCWTLGDADDTPKPRPITYDDKKRNKRMTSKMRAKKQNPFAAAAGMVAPSNGSMGRVYVNLIDD